MDLIDRNILPFNQRSFVVTGTSSFVLTRAVGIPYKTLNGFWWFKFHIYGTSSSITNITLTIPGVTFHPTIMQAIVGYDSTASASGTSRANTIANTSTIYIIRGSASTDWVVSGDVELAGKPTWIE